MKWIHKIICWLIGHDERKRWIHFLPMGTRPGMTIHEWYCQRCEFVWKRIEQEMPPGPFPDIKLPPEWFGKM